MARGLAAPNDWSNHGELVRAQYARPHANSKQCSHPVQLKVAGCSKAKWENQHRAWHAAKAQFAIQCGGWIVVAD